jgi:hypothetical protein
MFKKQVSVTLFFAVLAGCAPQSNFRDTSNTIAASHFYVPLLNSDQIANLKKTYGYVDPLDIVPANLRADALAYFQANQSQIANQNYISVVDFSANSKNERLFIINMQTGSVLALHVAHGMNSDPSDSGFATQFSNVLGSDRSSLGFFLTAETYTGDNGLSLRLDGLSTTNSNVRERDIVVHGAAYVYDKDTQAGRSLGCFAVPMDDRDNVINILKNGSLLYAGLSQ